MQQDSSNRTFVGEMPERIARLPRDRRGYPVPKFVHWQDGVPMFPVVVPEYMKNCVRRNACWICGDQLGRHKVFVIGPMCCVNRVSAEPPSHYECAQFAALNCPFLARPLAKRTVDPAAVEMPLVRPPGVMIERNPGVTALWVTSGYSIRGNLFNIFPPTRIEFYSRARRATDDEVRASVESGLPLLEAQCRDAGDRAALSRMVGRFWILYGEQEKAA